jgi:acylphosphatase
VADLIKHYLISGRVQGVGYRAFTHRAGRELNLRGWVRNLEDGRVEVIAAGDADRLQRFEAILRQGPPAGRVDSLSCEECGPGQVVDVPTGEFAIRKDG